RPASLAIARRNSCRSVTSRSCCSSATAGSSHSIRGSEEILRPQRAGAVCPSPRLPARRWNRLLLQFVFAFQMGFQLLGFLTFQVIELGGVVLDLPPEAELRTDRQLLRDVLLYLFLPLEPGDLSLDQPLFLDRVLAHDGDDVAVSMRGDLQNALVGELE